MTKEQLIRKQAKQAFKNSIRIEQSEREFVKRQTSNRIVIGIMDGEDILPNDYPVYYGYLYVADLGNGNGALISSDIESNVWQLLRLLKTQYPHIQNLRRCNMAARNIF